MNQAPYILDHAQSHPEEVRERLVSLHEQGETVADILEFVTELEARKIKVPAPNFPVFDICGTGGTGKQRINLSTVLAIKLSAHFAIAKHGNKAASGRVGSFDLIESAGFAVGDTPEKVTAQLNEKMLSFVFAPAFHPALKDLAPIRKSIPHPTVFNYLGPLLNPVPLTAQMTGVSHPTIGEKLAEVCLQLKKPALLVHDETFGLDDVSIGGTTRFWEVNPTQSQIITGTFAPADFNLPTVTDFKDIAGGDVNHNTQIAANLLSNTATQAQQNFLAINYQVAHQFFQKHL